MFNSCSLVIKKRAPLHPFNSERIFPLFLYVLYINTTKSMTTYGTVLPVRLKNYSTNVRNFQKKKKSEIKLKNTFLYGKILKNLVRTF